MGQVAVDLKRNRILLFDILFFPVICFFFFFVNTPCSLLFFFPVVAISPSKCIYIHIHNLRSLNLASQLTHRHRHTAIFIVIIPPFFSSLFLSKLIPIYFKCCAALFSLGFPFTCEMEFGEFKTPAIERDEWGELSRGRRSVGYGSGRFGCGCGCGCGFGFGRWCSGWEEIRRVLFLQGLSCHVPNHPVRVSQVRS